MKETVYKISLKDTLSLLAGAYQVEDGNWTLELVIESAPCMIPKMLNPQAEGILPGVINRVIEMRLIQVPEPNDSTITIMNGIQFTEQTNGTDRDNSGPVESIESPGENSESVGKSISRSKRKSRRTLNG